MGIGDVCPGSSIFTDLCVPGHDLPCKCLCIHSLTDEIKWCLSFSVHKQSCCRTALNVFTCVFMPASPKSKCSCKTEVTGTQGKVLNLMGIHRWVWRWLMANRQQSESKSFFLPAGEPSQANLASVCSSVKWDIPRPTQHPCLPAPDRTDLSPQDA